MHFGKLTVIAGLAVEAWVLVLTVGAGLQLLAVVLLT
jgi:hypothetical protein